jgi:hypothetical protein
VLQIVTKMYFRKGVPLHSTVHRRVLYTNRDFLWADLVDLPVGELAPSTGFEPVSTVTLSVTEHLEAENPDGERSGLVATGGTELIDALADVLSFGLNAVFSRDGDLVRRLVPDSLDESSRSSASKLFRLTFDPHRFVQDAELDEMRRFIAQLVALKRSHFEAAMRAIRRIVRATQRAVDDPTIAYVDLVAALESLSDGTSAPAPTWDRLDAPKRRLVDEALKDADAGVAERVRQAVIEAERLGARSRFVAFVTKNVSPEYFRTEATDAVLPVRGADLERALKLAYDVRSRNVHVLEDLPPEAWVLGDRADTVSPPGMGTMLSLEGLARLARHVVTSYVDRAPVEVDSTFNWRASLPGQVRMQVAPQYWIWYAEGFHHESASRYFSGFVGNLADTFAGRNEGVADIRAVLERIEQLLPGTADGLAKTLMVVIYALWHRALAPSDHRPRAPSVLAEHEHLLQRAEVPSFVAGLLSNQLPDWTDDQWHTLATDRRAQRSRRRHLELPAGFDAALQVMAAERLVEAGRTDEARTLARFAVDDLPGNEPLMAWGAGLATGQAAELDLRAMVLDLPPDAGRSDEAPHSAGAPAVPPDREAGEHPPGDQPSARPPVAGDEDHADDIEAVGDGRNAGSEAESDDSQRASGEQHSADAQHV